MPALRLKTIERRIGVIGPKRCGKTVLLTSLINHLKFHDPTRFVVGKPKVRKRATSPSEVLHFREMPDSRGGGGLPWFDYEGYRNQFVQGGQWPAVTKDASQYAARFERTDWHLCDMQLQMFDLPGERVNDIPMMSDERDVDKAYALWSDVTCRRLEKDLKAAEVFRPFFERAADPTASEGNVVHEYKLAMARNRLAFRPYMSPSTFFLDRNGQPIRGTDPEAIAKSRYCGLGLGEEFVPLPTGVRQQRPEWATAFAKRFAQYRQVVLAPVVSQLRTCHGLVIMVDVLAILGHGTNMYNDYQHLLSDLLKALDPKDTTLDAVLRGVYQTLVPMQWRKSWISRIAFVAPKADRVPFTDRARLKGLMQQLIRHEARNCRGVAIDYFAVAAVVGAREVQGSANEMIGSTLYDAQGQPLQPGSERKFRVPTVPDTWPEHGWEAGQFIYPDVYPRVSPLANCPTEQSGLDDVFNFLCD